MSEEIYVIGHRNPDADAICSAIGYAAFKNEFGRGKYTAARCGNSNDRIDSILSTFSVPLPEFVGDVTPRVKDVMVKDVFKIKSDSICTEALQLIDDHDIRILPVVDDEDKLLGQLSIFDLGDYFIPRPKKEMQMRHVYTSIDNIIKALNAEVLHLHESERAEDLFVRVGAMDIRSFGHYYTDDEELAKSSVIVVGDRYDIQQRSIHSGVRLLVVTGGLPVEKDVINLAKERNVSLVVSPDDSATTSWIIRSAAQVDKMINTNITRFKPDEKITTAQKILSDSRNSSSMVVNDNEQLVGILTRTDLLKPTRKKIVLVDHNELSQAVPGADQVEILEIIDHHRLGNPPTQHPITFINSPLGSTSTIIADLYRKHKMSPSKEIAGILMGGIISDTLFLKGPTTTPTDKEILDWLSSIAETNPQELADIIFNSGSIIKKLSAQEVVRADMKIYEEGNARFSVSQVEELGFDNLWNNKDILDEALSELQKAEDLKFSALLITDINTQNSMMMIEGDQQVIDRITYPHQAANDLFELNNVVSRKKQLIPYLTTLLGQITFE